MESRFRPIDLVVAFLNYGRLLYKQLLFHARASKLCVSHTTLELSLSLSSLPTRHVLTGIDQEVWHVCSPQVPIVGTGEGFEINGGAAILQFFSKFRVLL